MKKVSGKEKIIAFVKICRERFVAAELSNSGVIVAYYLLLSLFPLLIVAGNILPFLKIDPNQALPFVKEVIPEDVYDFLGPAIKNLLTNGSGELLSISAIGTLWSASQGVNAMQQALNRAYGVEDRGNFLLTRILSAGFMAVLSLALIAIIVIASMGQMVLEYLQPIFDFPTDIVDTFLRLRWPVTLLGLVLVMTMIYRVLPNAQIKWRSSLPGTFVTALGWLLLAQFFGIYAQFFARKISGYQIIGSFIVVMLWLYLAAMIVVVGGILNAAIEEYKTGEKIKERPHAIRKKLPWFRKKTSK